MQFFFQFIQYIFCQIIRAVVYHTCRKTVSGNKSICASWFWFHTDNLWYNQNCLTNCSPSPPSPHQYIGYAATANPVSFSLVFLLRAFFQGRQIYRQLFVMPTQIIVFCSWYHVTANVASNFIARYLKTKSLKNSYILHSVHI